MVKGWNLYLQRGCCFYCFSSQLLLRPPDADAIPMDFGEWCHMWSQFLFYSTTWLRQQKLDLYFLLDIRIWPIMVWFWPHKTRQIQLHSHIRFAQFQVLSFGPAFHIRVFQTFGTLTSWLWWICTKMESQAVAFGNSIHRQIPWLAGSGHRIWSVAVDGRKWLLRRAWQYVKFHTLTSHFKHLHTTTMVCAKSPVRCKFVCCLCSCKVYNV